MRIHHHYAGLDWLGLRGKLLLALAVLLLPMLGLLLFGFQQQDVQRQQVVLDQLTYAARATAALVDRALDQQLALAEDVASDLPDSPDPAVLTPSLRAAVARSSYAINLSVLDASGLVLATTAPDAPSSISAADRPYFQQALSSTTPVLSEVLISRATGRPVVAAAAPIGPAGQARGVVVVGLDLTTLADQLRTDELVGNRAIFLAGPSGTVAFHTARPDLPPGLRQLDPALSPEIDAARHGQTIQTASFHSPFLGDERAAAIVRTPTHGWIVGVTAASADAFGPIQAVQRQQVVGFALLALLAAIAAWLLATAFTRPLALLAQHARAWAAGDLSQRLPVRGTDELATLGASFNRMAASLDQDRQALVAAEQRARLLADAGEVLASSLQVSDTFGRLVRLIVPRLADWCLVEELREDGSLGLLALAHADPAKEPVLRALRDRYPPRPAASTGVPLVSRSGQPILLQNVLDNWQQLDERTPEQVRLLEEVGAGSGLCVPLRARNRIVGTLTLVQAASGRVYGPQDVQLAEELGRRCALALDNAHLYARVQDALRLRELFLASVAHDLRNPLTAIRGNAQLLLRQPSDPQDHLLRERLGQIEASASSMSAQLEDLLDLARMDAGQPLPLQPAPVDLVALARQAVADQQLQTSAHTLRLLADGPLPGAWDGRRLRRVLDNLLSNAVKYSPAGGEVQVRVWRELARAALSVTDHGLGIPASEQARVFERFHRAPNARAAATGTGLGLAGARAIVEQHGGTITLDSAEGRGTTVTLRLPLAAVPGIRDHPLDNAAPDTAANAARRVLVADDDAAVRGLVVKLLRGAGYQVDTVGDGEAAFNQARSNPPDALVLDLMLPIRGGRSVLQALQSDPRTTHLPVILVTASRSTAPDELLRLGAFACLTKPFDARALLDTLHAAITTRAPAAVGVSS